MTIVTLRGPGGTFTGGYKMIKAVIISIGM